MPASHERIPNRLLSGVELRTIILKDVQDILEKDGMFTNNIAFGRVAYEVRVSVHMDNPYYPEHVSTTLSRRASDQQIESNPGIDAIELGPLIEPLSDNDAVFSEERQRQIASPNLARAEHDLPIQIQKRNMQTGIVETHEQKFKGEFPDPAEVGNVVSDKTTIEDQRQKWNRPRRAK
jgi:hypothetical protein